MWGLCGHLTTTPRLPLPHAPSPFARAEDSVNAEAAAELHRGLEEFEKHARDETQKWAMDG